MNFKIYKIYPVGRKLIPFIIFLNSENDLVYTFRVGGLLYITLTPASQLVSFSHERCLSQASTQRERVHLRGSETVV